ncbi:hypothetical protein MD484_g1111, partial [Candolleomyces efflorescens]
MPKAKPAKFYAVLIGRNGPQIYTNWEEASPPFALQYSYLQVYVSQCKNKVSRFPGAVHKSFRSRKDAEDWLARSGPQAPIVISDDEDGLSKPSIEPTSIIVSNDDDNPRLSPAPKKPPGNTVPAEQAALDSVSPKLKTAIVLSPEQQAVLNALVLCGDFCQLPPISGKDSKGIEIPAQFAFEAEKWTACVGRPMMLNKVFRQKDQRFVDMLNEMRFGELQPETILAFQNLSRKVQYTDGIEPTELYSMRHEVQYANSSRLNQLPGKEETFTAHDMSGVDSDGKYISEKRRNQLLEKLVCQQRIALKVGAQVMLIKNLVQGQLVNGSIGKVVSFSTLSELAQDETMVRSEEKDGVFLPDSSRSSLPARAWPVVKFINGDQRVITPVDFELNNAEGKMEARRLQVPLILAWALSVHKSQGQTLERVKVDLKRTFEKGQAYVAISRATTLEHLQILHFEPTKVMTHPRVLEWYGHSSGLDAAGFEEEMDCEDAIRYYHDF